jgi:hypothetical protein
MEHCVAPLHVFLNEGRVSTRVDMHPIVLRALWLDAEVRNGSGNGGGVIIGFMPIVSLFGFRENYLTWIRLEILVIPLIET